VRLWKWELQRFATQSGLTIPVCHLPPGTSKWNKIEHRLFAFISQNWRGQPLLTHAMIVSLIAATRTQAGLTVRCRLDKLTPPPASTTTPEFQGLSCFWGLASLWQNAPGGWRWQEMWQFSGTPFCSPLRRGCSSRNGIVRLRLLQRLWIATTNPGCRRSSRQEGRRAHGSR